MRAEAEAVEPVGGALAEAGIDGVSFVADPAENGSAALHLLWPDPGVEYGVRGAYPGALVLVEGALPEPWRRPAHAYRGWRARRGGSPRTLAATAVETHGAPAPLAVAAVADDPLTLRGRPRSGGR